MRMNESIQFENEDLVERGKPTKMTHSLSKVDKRVSCVLGLGERGLAEVG